MDTARREVVSRATRLAGKTHCTRCARGAGPGRPFSRAATRCQVTWDAPSGRGVKRSCPKHSLQPKHSLRSWAGPRSWGRPFALLRLLTRTGPKLAPRAQRVLWVLPARRVARLTASRLAESINPWLFDHYILRAFSWYSNKSEAI
jgi:hypothetical protein